jgi:hypothetical protein
MLIGLLLGPGFHQKDRCVGQVFDMQELAAGLPLPQISAVAVPHRGIDFGDCKLLDVSKLTALGRRLRIDLEAGIRQTYEWYRPPPVPQNTDGNRTRAEASRERSTADTSLAEATTKGSCKSREEPHDIMGKAFISWLSWWFATSTTT